MAEHVDGAPNGDSRPRPDTTTQPGSYPSKLPFGIAVPETTGAPGSGGAGSADPDPTVESPLPATTMFGAAAANTGTGSPGSSGATPGGAGGASYTDPFKHLGGNADDRVTNGSTETQAGANKTGHPGPWGVANPITTGAGEGTPSVPSTHPNNGK